MKRALAVITILAAWIPVSGQQAPPPQPTILGMGVEILSDTEGMDFTPNIRKLLATLERKAEAVMPESAHMGETGILYTTVQINPNGSLGNSILCSNENPGKKTSTTTPSPQLVRPVRSIRCPRSSMDRISNCAWYSCTTVYNPTHAEGPPLQTGLRPGGRKRLPVELSTNSQLCEMGLHRLFVHGMVLRCGVSERTQHPPRRRVRASVGRWRSPACPDLREKRAWI